MPARSILTKAAFARCVGPLLAQQQVPLLVLRLREVERIAWLHGRAPARRLEQQACAVLADVAHQYLRTSDVLVHDRNTEIFSIALRGRTQGEHLTPDGCRAALERTTAAFARALPVALESGWTLLSPSAASLDAANATALERGAQERQRFDFFSTVAHEMRTPLAAIRGYVQTLLDERLDAAEARRFLEIARNETQRLGRMVDGMFAISLLDLDYGAAQPGPARSGTFAQEALEAALAALAQRIRERSIDVRHARMPGCAIAIACDHLVQVFINVIGNALEHAGPGCHVTIWGARREREIEIGVDDDGPGIPHDERDTIFTLGYRARSTGSGLGLAVVRRLLEHAGGNVCATESPLGGARIVMRIPTG